MQQIALIADVHGNLPALEAVLDDIQARGVRRIFSLGDIVGKGPQPRESLDIVRAKCEKFIQGNWEENVLHSDFISGKFARAQIGKEHCDWLYGLPQGIMFEFCGRTVKLLHGRSVVSDIIYPDAPREKLIGLMDSLDNKADVVGFADIHQPFYRMLAGRILFNIGAVGNPCDQLPSASYAVMRGRDTDKGGLISIEIIRIPYDRERSIQAAMACPDMPYREEYCEEVRTATYQSRVYTRE